MSRDASDAATFPLDETKAHRFAGKFLQAFALMEQALDNGIRKLLDLNRDQADIVCSSIPFGRKVDAFFSAEGVAASLPDIKRMKHLRKTRGAIFELNTKRVMFAHNPFFSTEKGIVFRRVVTDTKLQVLTVPLEWEDIEALCSEAYELARRLDELMVTMKPYVPSLDFSDPRNSGYAALMF